ncbi:glycosyltransferase family 8 protein [Thermothelomyces heterothallicus CBS 203.75]
MSAHEKVVASDKIWASLITKDSYLPGLLTLAFSLRRVGSKYPLVALHTGTLADDTVRALAERGIPLQRVPYIFPGTRPPQAGAVVGPDGRNGAAKRGGSAVADREADDDGGSGSSSTTTTTTTTTTTNGNSTNGGGGSRDGWYAHDPRFRDCFTKLAAFSLAAYSRIVLLDADMLVRRNMDELFDLPLDNENRLFAATHACTCNPLHFAHYPRDWTPDHCAFTQQHADPAGAQTSGGSPDDGMGQLNGGLLVLAPSSSAGGIDVYRAVLDALCGPEPTPPERLPFADQSLLGLLFAGRWVALPYVYNALWPMRRRRVHGAIWRDAEVRNVHYILTPKPWEKKQKEEEEEEETKVKAVDRQEKQNGDGDDDDDDDGAPNGRQARTGRDDGGEGDHPADDADGTDDDDDVLDRWWWEVDAERRAWEAKNGIGEQQRG